ncbi:MAG TPA: AGE family epimerase/isomerase [Stellaceae bacterium]|nr:AGE family epimerase/isomerase [Stellaceae bacterium]
MPRLILSALLFIPAAHAGAPKPAATITALPQAAEWKRHFVRDILPFWETAAALGNPIGNFPTFRCNDGAVYNAQMPCAEFFAAPDWIRSAAGRQYTRMLSRQVFLYGVAFHLTGNPKYLLWAHAGVSYIIDHAFDDKTGNVVSYWDGGEAVSDPSKQTSQDVAYCLMGLSFYYYLTRDPQVLTPILQIEHYIRAHFYDQKAGLYHEGLTGPEADRLDLVAQLDQANAYMLLLTPLLPSAEQQRWREELSGIVQTIRSRFYDHTTGLFIGTFDRNAKPACVFQNVDTDFGHTIKTYWMLYFIGRLTHNTALTNFAKTGAPGVLQWAYLPTTGSWATQPTCSTGPDNNKSTDLDRTSTWWMSAELDQAALTFGISNTALLSYIPKTFAFWLDHMVDRRYGEVWDELTVPEFTPRLPKVHLWKNGYHTAEHAMIGYIMTSAIRSQPVTLYYAFPNCKVPESVRPYYYDGRIASHSETALAELPGFCRTEITFADVH